MTDIVKKMGKIKPGRRRRAARTLDSAEVTDKPEEISAAMPVPRPSSAPAASIAGVSQAFSSALLNIHDEQQENVTDYDI